MELDSELWNWNWTQSCGTGPETGLRVVELDSELWNWNQSCGTSIQVGSSLVLSEWVCVHVSYEVREQVVVMDISGDWCSS